ncbi:MAG: WD40 repeat domain-containing protein [Bryobacteraceae bacterium]
MTLRIPVIRPFPELAAVLLLSGRCAWPQLAPEIWSMVWSPDGKRLAVTASIVGAGVYDAATGKKLLSLRLHSAIGSITWSPDGRLATASQNNAVVVWDAESGEQLLILGNRDDHGAYSSSVSSVAWSPAGKRLATGTGGPPFNGAKVWDADTGKELLSLATDSAVSTVTWSPDGRRLAGRSRQNRVIVWDAGSGQQLMTLLSHSAWGPDRNVAWSPDGKRLLASADHTASVWDADSGKSLLTLSGHRNDVLSVAWSPDGKRLATASPDGTAKLWDAETGRELLTLSSHSGRLFSVAWSPDGSRLAIGSDCNTVKIWNAETGRELLTLEGSSQGCEGMSDTGGPMVSRAIAISLPDDTNFYIPAVGDGEMFGVIPVSNQRFAAIRIIPRMGARFVKMDVSALLITGKSLSQATCQEIRAWQSEDAGSYQGEPSDSLSLSGLARLDLPVLNVRVVHGGGSPTPGGGGLRHPYAGFAAFCACNALQSTVTCSTEKGPARCTAMGFVDAEKCLELSGCGQCCRIAPP